MVAAMAAFSIEDMLIKAAAETTPLGLILALFGLGGMLIFTVLTRRENQLVLHPAILSKAVLIRAVCEIIGRFCFALAITLTPLSSASAILTVFSSSSFLSLGDDGRDIFLGFASIARNSFFQQG